MTLREILESYSYQLRQDGPSHYRCAAVYRDGNNKNALRINRKNGSWVDFVESKTGNFKMLIELTLGKKVTAEDYQKILADNQVELEENEDKEEIIMQKTWSIEEVNRLLPSFKFYLDKGISKQTLLDFYAGYAEGGAMSMRMVFGVFNEEGQIIGWNGRAVFPEQAEKTKWKKIGKSADWCYPIFLPSRTAKKRAVFPVLEAIKEAQEVIIVESIGDALSLYENGIRNIIVTFGTKLSSKVCAFIASMGCKRIIIATNNDIKEDGSENVGARFGIDCFIQLSSLVSYNKIVIHLPQNANDFGDMQKEGRGAEIEEWYKNAPQENTVEMKKKILARMRELYKERKLSTQAVKMAKEIKEEIEE